MKFRLGAFCLVLVVMLALAGCGGGGNSVPMANAGLDQNVTTGTTVTLDGSRSSDADGNILTYSWTFTSMPSGSNASLSASSVVRPTFDADLEGSYVLSLVVNDGTVDSAADTVTITAATANSAPVANAGGDQNVATGSTVTLDGSASSDADSDPLTYSWTITSTPSGSSASLSDATVVKPTFTADMDGNYVLSLVVNDGTVDSAADTVVITAATANSAPVANAGGDQNVATGSTVTLDGSASSDADSDPLTYSWTITSTPSGSSASLSDATVVKPTFIADVDGDYVFSLVVNDGTDDSAADTVTITVFGTVTSSTGRVWMDKNLGASQVATAYDDSAAYGDYYQWGRGSDGHEKRTSLTTTILSPSDTPGHRNFITPSSSPSDWRSPQNDNLWQGVTGANNPCPSGFRLPTSTEWEAERATWSPNNYAGAFASPLKLPSAGLRMNDGSIVNLGGSGECWSSSVDGVNALYVSFVGGTSISSLNRARGLSVRCIQDLTP